MDTYSKLQNRKFKLAETRGSKPIKFQSFVGISYFGEVCKAPTVGFIN